MYHDRRSRIDRREAKESGHDGRRFLRAEKDQPDRPRRSSSRCTPRRSPRWCWSKMPQIIRPTIFEPHRGRIDDPDPRGFRPSRAAARAGRSDSRSSRRADRSPRRAETTPVILTDPPRSDDAAIPQPAPTGRPEPGSIRPGRSADPPTPVRVERARSIRATRRSAAALSRSRAARAAGGPGADPGRRSAPTAG